MKLRKSITLNTATRLDGREEASPGSEASPKVHRKERGIECGKDRNVGGIGEEKGGRVEKAGSKNPQTRFLLKDGAFLKPEALNKAAPLQRTEEPTLPSL
ncbi:hypothetical protein CYMTET_31873 [Cymbomonas tetramitiformis]|uniref:Uncharacterized protein n=1 Tax=Cymbomonas tetramitiformis TaxID=36881 RepID=A0AAE0FG59_9CHLO|nr:hypothetical protein CYMTET_31873 [Cymbomonas tetramitiformis]